MIDITANPIDVNQVLRTVGDPRCGASVLFLGTTRQTTDGKPTESLDYECYEPMAREILIQLEAEACRRWPIEKCCIVHRIGAVGIGETSIAIAVSSPHRADAFAAGQWLIDSVKTRVPIWKKEVSPEGRGQWQHPQTEPETQPRMASP